MCSVVFELIILTASQDFASSRAGLGVSARAVMDPPSALPRSLPPLEEALAESVFDEVAQDGWVTAVDV